MFLDEGTMGDTTKIVIAEDQKILREGLKALLQSSDAFEVVAEAEDGLEAVRCVERHTPDLLLIDLSMPRMSGISAIKDIKARLSDTRILVLTIHETEEYIQAVFQAGADGYCLKDASHAELVIAIKSVLSGNRYISPGISNKVLEGYLEERKSAKTDTPWDTLTQREKDVLKLVGEGYKNREIASYLCISAKTVEKHRSNIMKKLNIHTASGLAAYACEKGLVLKTSKRP